MHNISSEGFRGILISEEFVLRTETIAPASEKISNTVVPTKICHKYLFFQEKLDFFSTNWIFEICTYEVLFKCEKEYNFP